MQIADEEISGAAQENAVSGVRNRRGDDDTVEKAIQYIHSHYMQDIGVDAIARAIGITPNYLSSVFRRKTGSRLNEYLKRLRMERAKELFAADQTMSVSEVAEAVGYMNKRYFSKVFREHVGRLPSEYASSLQNDPK